jgi:N-acyl-D-aspartate/D-glutamate deacylase
MHHRFPPLLAATIIACGAALAAPRALAEDFDTLLLGGTVIDGTGAPARRADVAIKDGRIAAVGDLKRRRARVRLDVRGLVVAPGFIDVHNHADEDATDPKYRPAPAMIHQGVTTAVFGVDGEYDLDTFRKLKAELAGAGFGVNVAAYIGHNGLRLAHVGTGDRPPTAAELAAMQADVASAMREGALGLSTGLMYLPGLYATTEEVIALGRPAAPFGGLYDSHDRDPAFNLLDSVRECLDIARGAGLEAHVAHLKAVGLHNAGRTTDLIRMIEERRAHGETVTADVYPYDGASARLLVEVPIPPPGSTLARALDRLGDPATPEAERPAVLAEIVAGWRTILADPAARAEVERLTAQPPPGTFSWVKSVGYDSFRIVSSRDPARRDRMLVDLAAARGVAPFAMLADLILEEGATIKLTLGSIRENEVQQLLRQPWVMISSDGKEGGIDGGRGHPRYRGSFARVLGHYVRDVQLFPLETAVYKMSGLPASYLKLADRGVLRAGAAADVAVFDAAAIRDVATWDDPRPYAVGVRYVFVNGVTALNAGAPTGALAGRFLPFRGGAGAAVAAARDPDDIQ